MAQEVAANPKVTRIAFEDGVPIRIPDDSILVLQSTLPSKMRPELCPDPSTRMIFWHVLYYNLVQVILPFPGLRNLQFRFPGLSKKLMNLRPGLKGALSGFASLINASGALVIQDRSTLEQTEQALDCTLPEPTIIPLPLVMPPHRLRTSGLGEGPLRVAWVGRLYDFKVHILAYALQRLSAYARTAERAMVFHLVGDGPEQASIRRLDLQHDLFRLDLVGPVPGSELSQYLLDHADLVLAMGTSALEGGKLGIPTILLDFSLAPVRGDYRFRWLFEAKGGDVGHEIGPGDLAPGEDSLGKALGNLEADFEGLSRACYRHCLENHEISVIADRFKAFLGTSRFRYQDIPPALLRRSLPRRIYYFFKFGRNQKGK
ncbi:MAG: hypothetical protein ABSH53_00415 [Holophaga sp.]